MQTMFMKPTVCAAFGAAAMLLAGTAQAAGVPGQGTWETTLQPRDLNGDSVADAFYDTTLDVTWLRDAKGKGPMNWDAANTWAAGLDVYGVKGWRLPTMIDIGKPGCNFSLSGGKDCGYNVLTKSGDLTKYEKGQKVYSEMAHLFYVTLGNKAYYAPGTGDWPQPGWGLSNTGSFQNMQSSAYWAGLEYARAPDSAAWIFWTYSGSQIGYGKDWTYYALAVRNGDVAMVPEAQTYALLMFGLTGLAVVARRRGLVWR